MYYLNLVDEKKSDIKYERFKFSGGELNIKLDVESFSKTFTNKLHDEYDENIYKITIISRLTSSDNIMEVCLAKSILDRYWFKQIKLYIPYIPYARQDRVCNDGEPLSIKVFASIINSLNFHRVYVLDAHSDVSPALINNCINLSPHGFIKDSVQNNIEYPFHPTKLINKPILVSPDAGANKRIYDFYRTNCNIFSDITYCEKHRDLSNGKIVKTEVYAHDLEQTPCIVVDDICDGGATFIGIAEELKRKNAGDLYLYVTHGIFRTGVVELLKRFKRIFCTNSFKDLSNENVVQIDCFNKDFLRRLG